MSSTTAPPAFGDFTRLDDDTVKLVAYTIVSLCRDHEIIMPSGQDQVLVTDSMTPDAFTAMLISTYVAKRDWAPELTDQEFDRHRKHLRVYYVVSQRWPRESMRYEERQTKVLEEIKDRM
jgi:hypothetical protein